MTILVIAIIGAAIASVYMGWLWLAAIAWGAIGIAIGIFVTDVFIM